MTTLSERVWDFLTDPIIWVGGIMVVVALVAMIGWGNAFAVARKNCDARGGVMVRGFNGFECVAAPAKGKP